MLSINKPLSFLHDFLGSFGRPWFIFHPNDLIPVMILHVQGNQPEPSHAASCDETKPVPWKIGCAIWLNLGWIWGFFWGFHDLYTDEWWWIVINDSCESGEILSGWMVTGWWFEPTPLKNMSSSVRIIILDWMEE